MIAFNLNSLCRQAKLYYYDLLSEERRELIPKPIINHIKECQNCQEQLNQLEDVLLQAESHGESGQRQVGSTITIMLKLHFVYIGKPVTCEIVRPFLPGFLEPALEIRIPTPITTHLDNCRLCSEDLETMRTLNLNHNQLHRLSQLFAEELPEDPTEHSGMVEIVKSVAVMDFADITAEELKHLCKCPTCRALLYEERQKRCDSLPEYVQSPEFQCESVSASDIFDYVVPYGINPADDRYAKFRESLASHLRRCPVCTVKMQELHNTLYGIAERPESEVVTMYHIDDSAKTEILSESDDLYAGFPIRVEVKTREDRVKAKRLAPTVNFTTALKQKLATKSLKLVVKAGVAAAAVILVTVALLLNTPTATAITLGSIYNALEKVQNVYISSFAPDKTEPIQERWVSQTSNIYMTKTGKLLVLWDLTNKLRKIKQLGIDSVEITPMYDDLIPSIEKNITGSLGLMPFYEMSEVPEGAEWSRVTDEGVKTAGRGTGVYDLTWVEKTYGGSEVFKKWRFFVDLRTNLVQRIEIYRKRRAEGEYTLLSVKMVKYLRESEMNTVIKEASF
jgi:hypothetical protein